MFAKFHLLSLLLPKSYSQVFNFIDHIYSLKKNHYLITLQIMLISKCLIFKFYFLFLAPVKFIFLYAQLCIKRNFFCVFYLEFLSTLQQQASWLSET